MASLVSRFCISVYHGFAFLGRGLDRYQERITLCMLWIAGLLILSSITLAFWQAGLVGLSIEAGLLVIITAAVLGWRQQEKAKLAARASAIYPGYPGSIPSVLTASPPKLADGWYEVEFLIEGQINHNGVRRFEEEVLKYLATNMAKQYLVINSLMPASKILFRSDEDALLFRLRFARFDLTAV